MLNRMSCWFRPRVERLEDRLAPAVFNIPDGDVGALIAAVSAANVNNQPDTINLAANGTYTFAAAADPAAVTLQRSVFQANTAALDGGAVSAQATGGMAITGGVFAQNTSNGGSGGGAIFVVGPLSIADSNIRDNVSAVGGGGVWAQDT